MVQELPLTLDIGGGRALHLQIERGLREAIRAGRLESGTTLPSTRVLAQDLGVSRGVVVEAYDQLIAEGYLVARRGSATRVAASVLHTGERAVSEPPAKSPRYDFRLGDPNPASFPRGEWLASIRQVLKEVPDTTFRYGDPQGTKELRTALSAYLGRVRGVIASPSRIVVSGGFAQGLLLVCQTLRQRGARHVVMEDPCQLHQRKIVERAGLEPVGVPVDERGLRTDLLARVAAGAAVVTPAHQYPTGAVLAPERRLELCSWAERQGAVVVEDDYDAEYRYDREPIGSMQGLSPERVIYASSASKTLAPSLRLGWLVLPSTLAAPVAEAKYNDDLGSPVIEQLALAEFVSTGKFDRHLRRNRAVYRRRRDVLVAALKEHLPEVEIQGIAAGLHLVVRLPHEIDEARLVEAAAKRSVGIEGIARHRFSGSAVPPAILLGYGAISEASIAPGVERLRKAISDL
ncbi:MAG: PLP-dependent aminotransferase family protein [Actinomycetota bacterium]